MLRVGYSQPFERYTGELLTIPYSFPLMEEVYLIQIDLHFWKEGNQEAIGKKYQQIQFR